jgi:chromosome segregation ATPase
MVDFPEGSAMTWRAEFADGMRRLEGRVVTVTSSLQDLSVSVTAGFVEQREYTEFAFGRLDAKIDRVEASLGARIDRVEARLDRIEERLARVEQKLDRFIEVQMETNRLTDLRLRALER